MIRGAATLFGIGCIPGAPGTYASLAGCLAAWGSSALPVPARLALVAAVTLVGVPVSSRYERLCHSHDPSSCVIDELAGMMLTLAFVPVTPRTALAGLLLFRVFDIVKPWPISRLQRLPGGGGVMADDIAAGAVAAAFLALIVRLFP